jgi:hypothetical protein
MSLPKSSGEVGSRLFQSRFISSPEGERDCGSLDSYCNDAYIALKLESRSTVIRPVGHAEF